MVPVFGMNVGSELGEFPLPSRGRQILRRLESFYVRHIGGPCKDRTLFCAVAVHLPTPCSYRGPNWPAVLQRLLRLPYKRCLG